MASNIEILTPAEPAASGEREAKLRLADAVLAAHANAVTSRDLARDIDAAIGEYCNKLSAEPRSEAP